MGTVLDRRWKCKASASAFDKPIRADDPHHLGFRSGAGPFLRFSWVQAVPLAKRFEAPDKGGTGEHHSANLLKLSDYIRRQVIEKDLLKNGNALELVRVLGVQLTCSTQLPREIATQPGI